MNPVPINQMPLSPYEARRAGVLAYCHGKPRTANPHHGVLGDFWDAGWSEEAERASNSAPMLMKVLPSGGPIGGTGDPA